MVLETSQIGRKWDKINKILTKCLIVAPEPTNKNSPQDGGKICPLQCSQRNKFSKTNMAVSVFDVGPFLEGVSNLQGKIEDAIAKSRLLLEAIEGSQSKYVKQNEDYPVLRSLKGRLAASQVPNESLATELVKFKLNLESFVDEIFQSQESVRRIRRDFILQAKELDLNRDKLWYEKGELAAERKRLDLERKELDTVRLKLEKVPAKGDTGLGLTRNERTIESVDQPDENSSKPNNNNYCSSKGVMNGKYFQIDALSIGILCNALN